SLFQKGRIGSYVWCEADFSAVLHHFRQIPMQQRFSTVKSHMFHACLFRIIKQVTGQGPGELRTIHEIAAVSTTYASQIAIRSDCYGELARPWLYYRGDKASDRMFDQTRANICR